ncbi:low temperature requirement protein A [Micromonospora globbae]|uniref:low temperature requirement protein A n=1 Tax=Micromonospora globbae TaxID=1894969 RepID=UPI00379A9C69
MSGPERLLRHRGDPAHATFLELFFDLAFVFALNQLSTALLADLSIGAALRTALLLAAIWWLWVTTTWAADWYAPGTRVLRVLLVGSALGGLLMGAATPQALGERAGLFAGALVAVGVCRGLLGIVVLRHHPRRRRSLRILCWFTAGGLLWTAGGLRAGGPRPALDARPGDRLQRAQPGLAGARPGPGRTGGAAAHRSPPRRAVPAGLRHLAR